MVANAAVKRWDLDGDISERRWADGYEQEWACYTNGTMGARERRKRCERHAAELDPHIHGRLLRELQLLYVALSRGRRRLFIFDTNVDKRAAMFTFLASPVDTDDGTVPPVAHFSDEAQMDLLCDDGGGDARANPNSAATSSAADSDTTRANGGSLLTASSSTEWQTQGAALLANGVFAAAAEAFFKAGNHDGGWRAIGAELLRRADDAAVSAPARAQALRLRATRAYASGHAYADALAAARLSADAPLLAALERGAALPNA